MSAGWQSRALQIASSVEKRIALALPFFRIERLAMVMPTFSESSVTLILRFASMISMFTIIAIIAFHTVRSFSDFMSSAFWSSFWKTAAAVAIITTAKDTIIPSAVGPAASSPTAAKRM